METGRAIAILGGIAVASCLISTTWIVARRAPQPPASAPAASDELQAARDRITRLEAEVEILRAKVATYAEDRKSRVGDPEPPPPPPPPPAPGEPLKGLVLAADNKVGIFLISCGKKDGVVIGDELTVYRGDTFVAVVVVDKVFQDKASVVLKTENGKPLRKSDIKQGDKFARIY